MSARPAVVAMAIVALSVPLRFPTADTSERPNDLSQRAPEASSEEVTTWKTVAPAYVATSTRDVRSMVLCDDRMWVATGGGLEEYVHEIVAGPHPPAPSPEVGGRGGAWRRRLHGVAEGLDSADLHRVRCDDGRVVVETATGLCESNGDTFTCRPASVRAAEPPHATIVAGLPATSLLDVGAERLIGTPGDGVFRLSAGGFPERIGSATATPTGFVESMTLFRDHLLLGTFNDGLYAVKASRDLAVDERAFDRVVRRPAPFRMVNEMLVVDDTLYVAANEGLFVSKDGGTFSRVTEVQARGVTGLATDGSSLYATTAGALWRIGLRGKRRVESWWTPAGSKSLQGVVADATDVWLASEDRGVIHFDGRTFIAYDRMRGLPTSWVVSITSDRRRGVFAATLRDGVMHVDPSGAFRRLEGLPSEWTLSVHLDGANLWVGTQAGAVLYRDEADAQSTTADDGLYRRTLVGLPDGRVHAFANVGAAAVVATEAGLAVFSSESVE